MRAVDGIETHVERRATVSYTNPDIERAHSSKNYDLHGRYQDSFRKQIKERFKKLGIIPKRRDAVLITEFIFSASPSLFVNMNDNEIRQYFQDCYNWVAEQYGIDNIVSAMVHLDETTPHMHLCIMPITRDNKLCANDLFGNGGKLSKMQDNVHEKVFSKYGLERGDKDKKAKHVEPLQWKNEQRELIRQDVENYLSEKEKLRREIEYLESIKDSNRVYQLQQRYNEVEDNLQKIKNFIKDNKELAQVFIDTMNQKEKEENEKEI